jgi:putative sterol carrier protein
MAVKYLSDQWMSEVESALNANEAFQNAAKGQTAKLQNVVTGAPDGEVHYGFVLEGGKVSLTAGDVDGAEATITNDYETAVKLNKGELQGQAAFMQGKVKISGNLMKMMQLQGVLGAMGAAVSGIDVEY